MVENIQLVVEAGGAQVPGVCDRNGHRRSPRAGKNDHRGKYDCSKMNIEEEAEAMETLDHHVDCEEVMLEFYNSVKSKYEEHRRSDNEIQSDGEEMDWE